VVRNDIEMSIKKNQHLKSDIFGFGNAFYRLKYQKWQEMKDDWEDIFTSLPVEVNIKANIERTGLINKGVNPQ
jgi:spore germination protein KC